MGAHGKEDLEWVTAVFGFRCAWCFEIVRGTETSSRLLRFESGAHAQRGGRGEPMCAAALKEGTLDVAAARRRPCRHHALLDLNC
jgi:hypothetical protein